MRYILLNIILLGTTLSGFSQNTFDVEFDQRVSGDNLLVDIYMKKTSGDNFELGGCNLPFQINSSGVDLSQLTIVDSLTGKFSSKVNPNSYSGPSVNKSNDFTHVYFSRNYAGGGDGELLTNSKERILTVSVPIVDPCSNSEINWVKRGTLTDYSNKRIKKDANLIDSEIFEFTQPLSDPVILVVDNQLQTNAEGSIKWLLNGEELVGETGNTIDLTKEGVYTVETTNGCNTKTSSDYEYNVTGPSLEVSAAPNPFVNQTTISYNLPEDGNVTIEVFDAIGNKISTLVNGNQTKGIYSIPYSSQLSGNTSGVYFVKLRVGEETKTQRIVELINN